MVPRPLCGRPLPRSWSRPLPVFAVEPRGSEPSCTRLLRGQTCTINVDGKQSRDYTYVSDMAAANLAALERPHVRGHFNIGTGVETSVADLYERLVRAAGVDAAPAHAPARPGEQRRSCLDDSLAARELGWRPRVTLDDGLERTVTWYVEHRPWWERVRSGAYKAYYDTLYGARLKEGGTGSGRAV